MTEKDLTALVYEYEYWDPDAQRMVRSASPATLEAIRNGLGVPVLSSVRRVPLQSVDAHGRFRPGYLSSSAPMSGPSPR